MDLAKIEGIIDAIEGESKNPSPSHQNLARLMAMFCRELIKTDAEVAPPPVQEPELPLVPAIETPVQAPAEAAQEPVPTPDAPQATGEIQA